MQDPIWRDFSFKNHDKLLQGKEHFDTCIASSLKTSTNRDLEYRLSSAAQCLVRILLVVNNKAIIYPLSNPGGMT